MNWFLTSTVGSVVADGSACSADQNFVDGASIEESAQLKLGRSDLQKPHTVQSRPEGST